MKCSSILLTVLILCLLPLTACQKTVIKTTQLRSPTNNGVFIPSVEAVCQPLDLLCQSPDATCPSACDSLRVTIKNITNEDIEVDWDKTLFIENGSTSGTFMFDGRFYKDKKNREPNDVIFANSIFSKQIWPSNLIEFNVSRYSGWEHKDLKLGENGVYVTINAGGKVLHESVSVDISREVVQ